MGEKYISKIAQGDNTYYIKDLNAVSGSSLTSNNIIIGGGNSSVSASGKSIETSLTANSDNAVPTSKAVATYVATNIANATRYKGGFNANSSDGTIDGGNTTLKSVKEVIGDMYTVTTAGTFLGQSLEVGDSIIFKADVAAGTSPIASNVVFVEGTTSVSVPSTTPTLSWGQTSTIGTVEGVDLNVTMPELPGGIPYETDTCVPYVSHGIFGIDNASDVADATPYIIVDLATGCFYQWTYNENTDSGSWQQITAPSWSNDMYFAYDGTNDDYYVVENGAVDSISFDLMCQTVLMVVETAEEFPIYYVTSTGEFDYITNADSIESLQFTKYGLRGQVLTSNGSTYEWGNRSSKVFATYIYSDTSCYYVNDAECETHILRNGGSSDLIVTVPTGYVTPDRDAIELTCPAGGYCEVNFIQKDGNIYARGL